MHITAFSSALHFVKLPISQHTTHVTHTVSRSHAVTRSVPGHKPNNVVHGNVMVPTEANRISLVQISGPAGGIGQVHRLMLCVGVREYHHEPPPPRLAGAIGAVHKVFFTQ